MNLSRLYQLYGLYGNYGNYNSYGNYGSYGNYNSYGNYGLSGNIFSQILQSAASADAASTVSTSGGISTPMDEIFEEASRETGVDIRLLKAVGKAESNFKASATSRCGAMGVMQLMPATAKSLGVTDAYDARQNIMAGSKYLAKLLDKYDGDVRLALAAYNAGSGNVAKYGGIPPFSETQNYVKRVLQYAGTDFDADQALVAQKAGGNTDDSRVSGLSSLSAVSSDSENTDWSKMAVQLLQLQMQQKLQSILGSDEEDNSGWENIL